MEGINALLIQKGLSQSEQAHSTQQSRYYSNEIIH